jgi:hypothetical protein
MLKSQVEHECQTGPAIMRVERFGRGSGSVINTKRASIGMSEHHSKDEEVDQVCDLAPAMW